MARDEKKSSHTLMVAFGGSCFKELIDWKPTARLPVAELSDTEKARLQRWSFLQVQQMLHAELAENEHDTKKKKKRTHNIIINITITIIFFAVLLARLLPINQLIECARASASKGNRVNYR